MSCLWHFLDQPLLTYYQNAVPPGLRESLITLSVVGEAGWRGHQPGTEPGTADELET
jgi:hypothetical protein